MNQRVLVAGAAAVVLAILLLGLIAQDTEVDTTPPEATPVEPEPSGSVEAEVEEAPAVDPNKLARPRDVPEPDWPEEPPPPAVITPDDRRKMNYAVDDVIRAARDECILPWIDEVEDPMEAEIVFDAVLWNGQLYDARVRGLNVELPPDVRSCIGDRVWYNEWPSWDLPGELSLQRSVSYRNDAMMPD